MKEDFKTKLEQAYGSQWFKRGVPKAVYDKANQLASEKNYEITDASEEYSPWDCLTLIDYRRIADATEGIASSRTDGYGQ